MKLSEMTDAEKRAFGSLLRVMIGADRDFTPDEAAALGRAAEALGAAELEEVLKDARSHDLDEDEVRAEAQAVIRREAQETIYGVLFDIAATGTIVSQESRLLEWVADVWNLERRAAKA